MLSRIANVEMKRLYEFLISAVNNRRLQMSTRERANYWALVIRDEGFQKP